MVECTEEDNYDVCMKVDFTTDAADDILLLNKSHDVDTILDGNLKDESDVKVTVILDVVDNKMAVSFPKCVSKIQRCFLKNNFNVFLQLLFIFRLKHIRARNNRYCPIIEIS